MIPEVDIASFAAAHSDGAYVIDVREPFEYVTGHIPGAALIPMARVRAVMADLPRGERVYVICQSGNRSYTAAGWLRSSGIDAVSVASGTGGWIRAGKAVVVGARADESAA